MAIIKWAAVGVTGLMGLANLGQIGQDNVAWKILGLILALAAGVAVVGFISRRNWGTNAIIAIGAVNVVAALVGAVTGVDGWPVGLVLSALAILFGFVYAPVPRTEVAA